MEGRILDYNLTTKEGLIKNTVGDRYTFTAEDYRSQSEIKIGQNVDFDIVDGNKATAIYLLKGDFSAAAGAAVESFTNVLSKENFNKLSQSATDLLARDNVKETTQSVKKFLFKPFVLPTIGMVFIAITYFTFFRQDSLAGTTFKGIATIKYRDTPQLTTDRNFTIKFKNDNKADMILEGVAVTDLPYSISNNSVKIIMKNNSISTYRYDGNSISGSESDGSFYLTRQ